ncbi:MAG: tRNA pseudouridine(55) synthase TruB, partial [Bdellovibrionales bacterium]|nr:tRNA pseudouridine(55) synthase TruB [Bdellovibrionales bacterium]
MVLLVGEATKLSDYILNGDKSYRVKVKLGVRTDSLDMTGQVLKLEDVKLERSQIEEAALSLQGEFDWPVPLFSAVKKDGKKMYEYAHKDQTPDFIPTRKMKFWGVHVLSIEPAAIEAHLSCSKGSYIRAWASQLGEKLGVGGAIEVLERTISAPYELTNAMTLEEMQDSTESPDLWPAFIPVSKALPTWRTLTVRGKDEKLIHNGQISYDLERRLIAEQKQAFSEQNTVGVKILSASTGNLLAILEAQLNRGLKIRRVFKIT